MLDPSKKNQLTLSEIKLVARGLREYQLMFGLDEGEEPLKSLLTSPNSRILDCGASIGTFGISACRRSRELGGSLEVVNVDPVYQFPVDDISARNKEGTDLFLVETPDNPGWSSPDWVDLRVTELFPTPSDCIRYRLAVFDQWKECFAKGEEGVSWVNDSLPGLSKVSGSGFDLILVGNLLFAYADGDQLGASADTVFQFHCDSIIKMSTLLRSGESEIRIFPVGTGSSTEYARFDELVGKLEEHGLKCEKIASSYHFVKQWTHMLKISKF